MKADEYNHRQYAEGKLTDEHITELVEFWQFKHGLEIDGKAGPKTRAHISEVGGDVSIEKFYPLKCLADGRKPIITSKFKTENGDRSTHDGVDFFFKWLDSDPEVFSGHGGAIKKNGKRRWWYPDGAVAVAAASGVVQKANMTGTGFRVWIDHGNGERTGYFHGESGLVKVGDVISAGTPVIVIGDNPNGGYKKHLHFEVSPVDRYAPKNPRLWLEGASYL